MGYPTNLTFGISTVPQEDPLGMYPLPDPFHTSSDPGLHVFTYSNDYVDLGNTASRTLTGSATFALVDGLGGIGKLTPSGATTAASCYRTAAAFQFISGNKFWYLARLKYSAVGTGITGYFGMIKTGGATTDSLLFKLAATGVISFVSTVGSTATTLVSTVTTAVSDTYIDVGFYYNGTDLLVYAGDSLVGRVANVTVGSSGTTVTDAALTTVFQITPAATETISIDYELAAQEMTR
jgi:hypothetical protein